MQFFLYLKFANISRAISLLLILNLKDIHALGNSRFLQTLIFDAIVAVNNPSHLTYNVPGFLATSSFLVVTVFSMILPVALVTVLLDMVIFPREAYFLLLVMVTLVFLTGVGEDLRTPAYSSGGSPGSGSVSTDVDVAGRLTADLPPRRLKTEG